MSGAILAAAAIGYLLGSIPFGLLLTRIAGLGDIRHIGLLDLLRLLTIGPARILGLDVGRLAPGAPADLVLFDPDAPWQIDTDRFRSKSKNAPFDGRPVQGRVHCTIVDGRTIFAREG